MVATAKSALKMTTAIIIPARYGSTRLPGKPLAVIAGKTMLHRVVDIGRQATSGNGDVDLLVATDDDRIAAHCRDLGVDFIMTSPDCPTGSDRVLAAAEKTNKDYRILIGLQGDAPFTPPEALRALIDAFKKNSSFEVVTPVVRLRWDELDTLREAKKSTPFSGTTAVIDESGRALWFSKNILPAIRKEYGLRKQSDFSPVYQHLGVYGWRRDILKKFVTLKQGYYETLEGLEQLRLLENGINVQTVVIEAGQGLAHTGIDSPEDLARAETLLKRPQDHL